MTETWIMRVFGVLGFIFAALAFFILPIFFFLTSPTYKTEALASNLFLFNPLIYAFLGVTTAAIIRLSEKSEYTRRWSNRIIIANLVALVFSIIIWLIVWPLLV